MKPKRKGTWFEPNLPSIWVLRVAQVGPNNTDPQLTDGQPKRNVTSITCRSEGVQVVLWCRGCCFTWNLCICMYIICKIMIWDVLNIASESDMEFNWPFFWPCHICSPLVGWVLPRNSGDDLRLLHNYGLEPPVCNQRGPRRAPFNYEMPTMKSSFAHLGFDANGLFAVSPRFHEIFL